MGSSVSFLLGNDGTFQSHTDYATGSFSVSIVAADFNRDGKVDLLTANAGEFFFGGPSLSFLAGAGNGTFSRTGTPLDFGVSSAAVGDFNDDGKPDLAKKVKAQPQSGKPLSA